MAGTTTVSLRGRMSFGAVENIYKNIFPLAMEKLYTPGPLTTHPDVRAAMAYDYGSRDGDFVEIVRRIRLNIPKLYGLGDDFTTVLIPGSGTYGVEAVMSTIHGKVLIVNNGAYGERMVKVARSLRVPYVEMTYSEDSPPNPEDVEKMIVKYGSLTHLAFVHCETSTGMFNPIDELSSLGAKHGVTVLADVMSSFGGVAFDASRVDFLMFSSNKCLEGVPGLAVVVARRSQLEGAVGRGLSLDLADQWEYMEDTGQFRFTPPVQVVAALDVAVRGLMQEGGVSARAERYTQNYMTLLYEMRRLGFRELIDPRHQSYIITSFRYPEHPAFHFEDFYAKLKSKGRVIYPGKTSKAECFRIANIGNLYPEDMRALTDAIGETLEEMGVPVPVI
jgi:2-aminoethylphosphonate-pyruvate transaminase